MCRCFIAGFRPSGAEESCACVSSGVSSGVVVDEGGDRERLQVLVIGSREGVLETIHNLHRRGFAEVALWSPLLPGPSLGEVMSILTKWRSR